MELLGSCYLWKLLQICNGDFLIHFFPHQSKVQKSVSPGSYLDFEGWTKSIM